MDAVWKDGLRKQPTWDELTNYIDSRYNGYPRIELPDRNATYEDVMDPFVARWREEAGMQRDIKAKALEHYRNGKVSASGSGTAPFLAKQTMGEDFQSVASDVGSGIDDLDDRVHRALWRNFLERNAAAHPEHYDIGSEAGSDYYGGMQSLEAATGADADTPIEILARREGVALPEAAAAPGAAEGGGADVLGLVSAGVGAAGGGGIYATSVGLRTVAAAQEGIMAGVSTPVLAELLPGILTYNAAAVGAEIGGVLGGVGTAAELGAVGGPLGALAAGTVAAAVLGGATAYGGESAVRSTLEGAHNALNWVGHAGSQAVQGALHLANLGDAPNNPAPLVDHTTLNEPRPQTRSRPVPGSEAWRVSAAAADANDYNRMVDAAQERFQPQPGGLGRQPMTRQRPKSRAR